MSVIFDALSWVCVIGGSFFAIAGGIGILRLPDVSTRLHATGMTDTTGAGLILIGLIFQVSLSFTTVKLVLILLFLWLTSPVATHAAAHAALRGGMLPTLGGQDAERR